MDPNPLIENIPFLSNGHTIVDTLRLDAIHPIISGNKWYKLRYYLDEALKLNATSIASFGGPYSNHLVALSYAAKLNGLKSLGYVRSNKDEPITPSLQEALNYGMELIYLGRSAFNEMKDNLIKENSGINYKGTYFVDEGGYGVSGAKGAATIISDWDNKHESVNNKSTANTNNPLSNYDYIICAVGTGTMIAGIINATEPNQKIIGIPVLKNEGSIESEIKLLLHAAHTNFELFHEFHQGGYAKTTQAQINFMNLLWIETNIPTDIVYTGKVFYAVSQLINRNYFTKGSRVLIIHSGGLQGNRSLAKGILKY